LWAWSNIREPKFSPADVENFNLSTVWAWLAFFAGLGAGLAVSYLVLLPYQFRVSRFSLFLLTLCIFLAVGPAIEAVVVWLASMLKANNKKPDAA
jgi:hypothetical protein